MTRLQKKIFECLFRGGHIVKLIPGKTEPGQLALFEFKPTEHKGPERYSVRESNFKLVSRIGLKSTPFIFSYCREVRRFKTTVYEINKQQILQLNGNSWLKKTYKKFRDQQLTQKTSARTLKKINSYPRTFGYACFPCTQTSFIKYSN